MTSLFLSLAGLIHGYGNRLGAFLAMLYFSGNVGGNYFLATTLF